MKTTFLAVVLVASLLYSCGSDEAIENDTVNVIDDEQVKTGCDALTTEDFDEFLGIKYGTKELNLEKKIGKFTGGEYAKDSAAFIYYFNRVDRVPVSIWVNTKSGKVETVFMEVLSYTDINFESDLSKAVQEFKMNDCDASWFGMKEGEIENRLGEPTVKEYLKDSVLSVSYDSEDYLYAVNFKFYPSQKKKCSSISINWFYQ